MTKKVYILLDRSGSMDSMWKEAISGINSYVEKLYGTGAEIFVAAFDSDQQDGYVVVRNTNTANWRNISEDEIRPRGGTPLLDAAGRIIWNMMDSKAERAMLVVVTDGHENASTKFKASEIKDMTKTLTSKYNYDIVFLGANFDGINDVAAQTFGFNDQSRVMASSIRGFGSAMNATASATANYLSSGVRAESLYTAKDKADAKA